MDIMIYVHIFHSYIYILYIYKSLKNSIPFKHGYEDSLLDATFGKASHAKSERDEKVKL